MPFELRWNQLWLLLTFKTNTLLESCLVCSLHFISADFSLFVLARAWISSCSPLPFPFPSSVVFAVSSHFLCFAFASDLSAWIASQHCFLHSCSTSSKLACHLRPTCSCSWLACSDIYQRNKRTAAASWCVVVLLLFFLCPTLLSLAEIAALRRPQDLLIEKYFPSSFTNTNLAQYCKENGIGQLVICGCAFLLSVCCSSSFLSFFCVFLSFVLCFFSFSLFWVVLPRFLLSSFYLCVWLLFCLILRLPLLSCSLFSRYMTQMCCDSTSREAFHRGMKVIFLKDATGTLNIANQAGSVKAKDLHTAILVTQQSAFSIVMTTKAWIDSLSSSSSPLLFVCIEEQGSATVPTRSPPVKFKIAIQRSSL